MIFGYPSWLESIWIGLALIAVGDVSFAASRLADHAERITPDAVGWLLGAIAMGLLAVGLIPLALPTGFAGALLLAVRARRESRSAACSPVLGNLALTGYASWALAWPLVLAPHVSPLLSGFLAAAGATLVATSELHPSSRSGGSRETLLVRWTGLALLLAGSWAVPLGVLFA